MAMAWDSRWIVASLMLALGCSGSAQNTATATPTAPETTATSGGATGAAAGGTTTPATNAGGNAETSATTTATTTTPPTPGGTPAASDLPPMPTNLHGPATPWAQMSHEDRGHYMRDAVMPAMREMFRAYDGTRYAEITCATCHGPNARDVQFRMPNGIMPLAAFGSDASNRAHAEHPRAFQFMGTRVVPAMSQILGVAPFDMSTHQGFGCFNCHGHQT